jgi:hypothetical protein
MLAASVTNLDELLRHAYAGNFMYKRWLATALAASTGIFALAGPARAADDATLLRVFLRDGSSLVSYGEPAQVGDRVVFSMPTASTPNPPLHLVNLAADRVDLDRTNRYASAARAARYVAVQADIDYAELSNQITQALNAVAVTTNLAERLRIVQKARNTLADWPQNHFNYKLADVRQMLAMLDEAIADLRAAAGERRFDLSLTAFVDPPTITESLLPPPTPRESIEQVLLAARYSDSAADRMSLLSTAAAAMEREKASLPPEWLAATRAETDAQIKEEARLDSAYRLLTAGIMAVANDRANYADVRGLERLVNRVHARDAALGYKRAEAVTALIGELEAKLDAARKVQLARDRWALRAPAFRRYHSAIQEPMDLFAQMKPSLENIKALAGSSPASLLTVERLVAQITELAATVVPPQEMAAAHALLVSAAQLAGNAARIRREATLAGDLARAWDASSAAAGALMLGARARADIQSFLRPPSAR